MQFSKNSKDRRHPTLLAFDVSSIKGCLDPLFLRWLDFRVTYYKLNTVNSTLPENPQSDVESTLPDSGRKKTFPSLHESVHSSSDKDKRKSEEATHKSSKKSISKDSKPDKILLRSESRVQEVIF